MAVNESFFAELKKQFGDLDETLGRHEASIERFGNNVGESLAGSLQNLVIVIDFVNQSLGLLARALDQISLNDKFTSFISLQVSQFDIMKAILQELINDLAGLAGIFKETLPVQEQYHDAIVRIAEGYGDVSLATDEANDATKELDKFLAKLRKKNGQSESIIS